MIELLLLQYVPPPPSSSSTETIGNLPLSLPDELIRAMRQIVNEGSTTTDYENVTIGIDINTAAAAAATAVAVATTANNAQLDEGSSGNMHQILTSYLTKSSYAREKNIRLIVDRYSSSISSSSTSSRSNMSSELDNAFEVLYDIETDSDPIPITGYPYLYIGSVGVSSNHYALRKRGISYIINWSTSSTCNHDVFPTDNIVYACISGIRGKDMANHLDRLDGAVDLIERTRKEVDGSRIMCQCFHGKHISITILVAYLMKHEGMNANEATALIKKTRPKAAPYFNVLEQYSKKYIHQ